MNKLTLKQAMYIAWFMAVTRKLSTSNGDATDGDYEGHVKNIANLYLILGDEGWAGLNISKQEEIEISDQSHYIYLNKYDEVKWAAENMQLTRLELSGVGSLISQPLQFKTNLFDGPNCLNSF
tara:strand:+ start:172 stop:540 length:369 start_codon:yes stop_codon:yes gene_type:complete